MIERDNLRYLQMFRKLILYRERNMQKSLLLKGCV
jgi:hypothetical protein